MSEPLRGRRVKIALGLALALAGHGGITWSVRSAICDDVRSAVATRGARPDLEGRVVAVTGPLESRASVEDADFLARDAFFALARRVEVPRVDTDGDLQWDTAHEVVISRSGATLVEQAWFVEQATVGGLVVPVAAARQHGGLPRLDLTAEQVNLAVATREYPLVWDGASHAFHVPAFPGSRKAVTLTRPQGEFIGRVRFYGARTGSVVTAVGRLRRGALTGVRLSAEGPESVLIAHGERTPSAIAADLATQGIRGSLLGYMVLATAGLLLVFMPPHMVVIWFFFMGVGQLFGTLAAEGLAAALPHALLLVAAIGALVLTTVIAYQAGPVASAIWLLVFAALAAALKRSGAAEGLEEEL